MKRRLLSVVSFAAKSDGRVGEDSQMRVAAMLLPITALLLCQIVPPNPTGQPTAHHNPQSEAEGPTYVSLLGESVGAEPQPDAQQRQEKSKGDTPSNAVPWFSEVRMWLSVVLYAFVAVIAFCTFCLTRRSVEHAKEAAYLDQRPWLVLVGVENTGGENRVHPWDKNTIRLFYAGAGKFPARSVVFRQDWDCLPHATREIHTGLLDRADKDAGAVYPPGPRTWPADYRPENPLPPGKGEIFYVYGTILYRDHLDEDHVTRWCYYYDPEARNFYPVETPGLNKAT
jgi:hypothetical protein